MMGVLAIVAPVLSFATAVNEKAAPERSVVPRTGGFTPPAAGGGAAVIETGPPLNTVSPAASR